MKRAAGGPDDVGITLGTLQHKELPLHELSNEGPGVYCAK